MKEGWGDHHHSFLKRNEGGAGWPPPFSREDDQSSRKEDISSRDEDLSSGEEGGDVY